MSNAGPVENHEGFSHIIESLRELASKEKAIPFGQVVEVLGTKGFGLVTFFFTLPFVQPMPLPGISAPFGLIIMLNGIALVLGRNPWLPQTILNKELNGELITKLCTASLAVTRRIEKWIRPRSHPLRWQFAIEKTNGIMIAICGFIIALPLVFPGTNVLPGLVIIALVLGTLEEDGWMVFLGQILFVIMTIVTTAVIWYLIRLAIEKL